MFRQLLEPIVSVVAANTNPEQQRPELEMRGKSKAIFIEQVREHVERGQLSWQDVRDEANVTIAAVGKSITFKKIVE